MLVCFLTFIPSSHIYQDKDIAAILPDLLGTEFHEPCV